MFYLPFLSPRSSFPSSTSVNLLCQVTTGAGLRVAKCFTTKSEIGGMDKDGKMPSGGFCLFFLRCCTCVRQH